MAFISVSGEPGSRHDELARMTAQRLECYLATDSGLSDKISSEFSGLHGIPDKAWPHLAASILAKMGVERHVVISTAGAERLFRDSPRGLSVYVTAPESRRVSNLMVDRSLSEEQARALLFELDSEAAATQRRRFGSSGKRVPACGLTLNEAALNVEQMLDVIECAVRSKKLFEMGLLSSEEEDRIQFESRLKLARFGIIPPDRVSVARKEFGHPSEEVFANVLDFYRIAWDYEPRSFPLQWDKDGKVLEAFTPDFYLPEFDLYIELTTMKQANVTRKNRKLRLLKAIYPHVNIQIFYQKDVHDLVVKYGLPERLAR